MKAIPSNQIRVYINKEDDVVVVVPKHNPLYKEAAKIIKNAGWHINYVESTDNNKKILLLADKSFNTVLLKRILLLFGLPTFP